MTTLGDKSLTLISYIDDILSSVNTSIEIINSSKSPSGLVDSLDDLSKHVKRIDSTVSIMPEVLMSLTNEYDVVFGVFEDLRNAMIVKVNERKASDVQMNNTSSLFSDEIMLKDIYITMNNDTLSNIINIKSDELIDPKYYSCHSIVNKMESEKMLLKNILNNIKISFSSFTVAINELKQNMLEIRSLLSDPGFINELCQNDSEGSYKDLSSKFNSSTYRIINMKECIKKAFQIYLDLDNNYKIYQKAVDMYTSMVLESMFSMSVPYELM